MDSIETLSVSIARPYGEVYEYLADPTNLRRWVDVLGPAQHPVAPMEWVFERPKFQADPIRIRFTPRNSFGVLDVAAFSGGRPLFWAPARAIALGNRTVVTLGLVYHAARDQSRLASERAWIQSDLDVLKSLLESA